ncbi:uncharacterized protein LOC143360328 [Halictus rubicundus]|uniref:uncharacterized protein LOC143360328 n=1 Tax=Halictus rubicundus TaxID=77578 RepID=UPI004036B2DB
MDMEPPAQNMAVAVDMAKFWAEKPALWFAHLDAQFGLRGITQEDTKYHHVEAQLDVKTAEEVEDILLNPPEQNKYTRLKEELIARLSTSKQRKMKQLLEHEERGDRTPSQFLLPVTMQSVLATQDGVELEKVAALTDRISEVTPAQIHPAAAANNVAALGDIDALVEQIAACVTTKLKGRGRQPRRSTRSSRYRRRYRSKSKAESRPSGICWYHGRFGDKATKCTKPCTFQSGNDPQSR